LKEEENRRKKIQLNFNSKEQFLGRSKTLLQIKNTNIFKLNPKITFLTVLNKIPCLRTHFLKLIIKANFYFLRSAICFLLFFTSLKQNLILIYENFRIFFLND
jgi:hypothetical protein